MKIVWKTLTSIGKKYKNGSTATFTKTKSSTGKTKYVKSGYSGKQPRSKKR